MADTLTLRLLRFLPKNLVSRGFGWIAGLERPKFLVRPFMRWFAKRFGLDLDEAALPFEAYPSLLAMFTRELAPNARVVDPGRDALVSPVDGVVGASGRIEDGRLIQAKGMDYTAAALLGSAAEAERFHHGFFATIYLSPRDYHRIHSPVDGTMGATLYEPGTLWPVNPPAVRSVPQLFAVNERVTTIFETAKGPVALAMVGATNVGSIRLAESGFVSNRGGPRRHDGPPEPPAQIVRGQHVATFELGSTVVLLVADTNFHWLVDEGSWYAYGTAIGRFDS